MQGALRRCWDCHGMRLGPPRRLEQRQPWGSREAVWRAALKVLVHRG